MSPDPTKLSEAEFLKRQAEEALAAMSRSAQLLKKNLGETINPAELGRSHPWVSIAGAAAGGFLLVALAGRHGKHRASPVKDLDERLELLRRRVNVALSGEETSNNSARMAGLDKGVLYHAWRILRPIVISTISSAVSARAAHEPAAPSNGHDSDPSDAPADAGPNSI